MNYDKKIAKHYANLCELTKRASPNSTLSYDLISAFCIYFKNAKKPAFNAEQIIERVEGELTIDNFTIENSEDLLRANSALYALSNYKSATSECKFDNLAKSLLFNIQASAIALLNGEDRQAFYPALSCLLSLSKFDAINKTAFGLDLYNACKTKLQNINPIADNAPCDLLLNCALGAFEYEKEGGFAICERIFELVSLNSLSINFSIGKSLLSPQVSSPSATALALKLCVLLYRHTGKDLYLFMLRRIWFNGMQFCQRPNGGVGYDTFALMGQTLALLSYEEEALSPIYTEGLSLYTKHPELFVEKDGEVKKDSFGRYFIGDKMFARDISGFFGKDLIEIPSLTSFDKETALQLKLKLNF